MTNDLPQMTLEEAIIILKRLDNIVNNNYSEAIYMAIKALERESITWIVGKDNCQVAVRNMPIDKMKKICAIIGDEGQQPCEDCISREDAIRIAEQGQIQGYEWQFKELCKLPSVTPSIKEWLSSFDTDSATECFTAVQELKKEIENEEQN